MEGDTASARKTGHVLASERRGTHGPSVPSVEKVSCDLTGAFGGITWPLEPGPTSLSLGSQPTGQEDALALQTTHVLGPGHQGAQEAQACPPSTSPPPAPPTHEVAGLSSSAVQLQDAPWPTDLGCTQSYR